MKSTRFIIFVSIFFGICGIQKANAYEYNLDKVDFVSTSLKKENQIEIIKHNLKSNKILATRVKCKPKEKIKNTDSGALNYVQTLRPKNKDEKIEVLINGVYAMGDSNSEIIFTMIENCKKIFPITFMSSSDQDYMGTKIKKGDKITTTIVDPERDIAWGTLNEDGYYGGWKKEDTPIKKVLGDDIEGCTKVETLSKDIFYIYKGRKIPKNRATPKFWRAKSKYIGNRLCSDQPDAIIDCSWDGLASWEVSQIFGENKSEHMEIYQVTSEEYDKAKKTSIEYGQKCDQAVRSYEKKTGKKVPISYIYKEFHNIE